ncbi:hypothetical protein QQ045_025523 [Rhodiola kirilowii]
MTSKVFLISPLGASFVIVLPIFTQGTPFDFIHNLKDSQKGDQVKGVNGGSNDSRQGADPGSLKGNDKTDLKVPHIVLVSLARDAGTDWDIDYQLILGLVINLLVNGNFTIPISSKGEIKLPSLFDIF